MANVVLIVGDQGTGKSTSIESLDSKQTFMVNCASKPLPFKGSGELYKAGVNLYQGDGAPSIISVLDAVDKNSTIKNLIIDDSGFIMSEIYFKRAAETGFGKFTAIAQAYQSVLSRCKSMRSDLNVAVMMHEENEVSNSIIVGKKGRTVGKLVGNLPVYA
jgi:septin family protein